VNLETLLMSYDALLVDLYGVVWGGAEVFPEALEALRMLLASGKCVVMLSNSSLPSDKMLMGYDCGGLVRARHFSDCVTSGDALRSFLLGESLQIAEEKLHSGVDWQIENVKKLHSYYTCGVRCDEIFRGTGLKRVDDLHAADFVYLSIPRFSDVERDAMGENMRKHLHLAKSSPNRKSNKIWDSDSTDPYTPKLRMFLETGKQLLVANPDKFAICSVWDPKASSHVPKIIVKQGSIADLYIKMGGKVLTIGKPFPHIYGHALRRLAKLRGWQWADIPGKSIAMIGDSLETDISGANNAGEAFGCKMDGILVMTGISGAAILHNYGTISRETIGEFALQNGAVPAHAAPALDLNAELYF
jgi:ribonucleotide monophosphatase NagD (HAD superfamily)